MTVSLSPALSLYSQCSSVDCSPRPIRACHSRTTSESLLFTPPLSPTEEQLLALLIPDIEPAELAAYLSAPTTPVLSDVSCLIGGNISVVDNHESHKNSMSSDVEAVYPSPVCAAAAATVVALDRLDTESFSSYTSFVTESEDRSHMIQSKKKRCSMYAFIGSDDEEDQEESSDVSSSSSSMSPSPNGPVYVMSSRNTRKRLMLEQPFVSPDDEDDSQNCYAQLFQGTSLNEVDSTSCLTSTLAFDLVLV